MPVAAWEESFGAPTLLQLKAQACGGARTLLVLGEPWVWKSADLLAKLAEDAQAVVAEQRARLASSEDVAAEGAPLALHQDLRRRDFVGREVMQQVLLPSIRTHAVSRLHSLGLHIAQHAQACACAAAQHQALGSDLHARTGGDHRGAACTATTMSLSLLAKPRSAGEALSAQVLANNSRMHRRAAACSTSLMPAQCCWKVSCSTCMQPHQHMSARHS